MQQSRYTPIFILRYTSAYFLVQSIKRAAKATAQRPQMAFPHLEWSVPVLEGIIPQPFMWLVPEEHFACKLFAAINASLWLRFREMCLDQLQELVPQPCSTKTSWANINALITRLSFVPIAGDTWAGLVKLGDVELPEHPWSVWLRKMV